MSAGNESIPARADRHSNSASVRGFPRCGAGDAHPGSALDDALAAVRQLMGRQYLYSNLVLLPQFEAGHLSTLTSHIRELDEIADHDNVAEPDGGHLEMKKPFESR